jgi:copper chaperone CopZ
MEQGKERIMDKKTVTVPNITCHHCVATIKRELAGIAGVNAVEGDPRTKKVTVTWTAPASWDQLRTLLEEIGYPPQE